MTDQTHTEATEAQTTADAKARETAKAAAQTAQLLAMGFTDEDIKRQAEIFAGTNL